MHHYLYSTMFIRFAYITLLLFTLPSLALAGDDDKKGNDKDKPKTVKTDSIINVDVNKAASDDTLVFEDWEKPGQTTDENNKTAVSLASNLKDIDSPKEFETTEPTIEKEQSNMPIEVTIYPNPTTQALYFTTPETPNSIRILWLNGTFQNVKVNTQSVDVSYLPQGTYFIQLIFTNRIESRKFIKS